MTKPDHRPMVLATIRDLGGRATQKDIVAAISARCDGGGPSRAAVAGTLRQLVNAGTVGPTNVFRPIVYFYPPATP